MKKILLLTLLLIITHTSFSQIDTSKLDNFIQEWWNVPYRFGGNSKRGIDCSRFTQRLYKDVLGKNIPNVCWKQWEVTQRVNRDSLQVGDLIFFKSRISPSGWHVGVYLWNGLFVHAANRKDDIKISDLDENNYKQNYKGAGRL